jgi:two-component system response regulator ResD
MFSTDQPTSRVLIVEDEPDLLNLYVLILEKENFQVDKANDGATALELLKKGGYDLVLLDMMLPKLNGLEVLESLQKNPPAQPNKKIILLTNMMQDATVQQAMQLGAQDFMIKSEYNPAEFVDKIKTFFA